MGYDSLREVEALFQVAPALAALQGCPSEQIGVRRLPGAIDDKKRKDKVTLDGTRGH
jgi:hypothetical protein